MTDERYKKIMADLGFPNMRSLLAALQQVANEAGQECAAAEREACAKVCEQTPQDSVFGTNNECAAAIRMRSNVDTLENAQRRAEYWKAESMAATNETESLRAQVAELADAFTVIWVSDDRAAWDGKAVEHFDALLAKVGGSDTATPNAIVRGGSDEQ